MIALLLGAVNRPWPMPNSASEDSVQELGRLVGVATPTIDVVLALVQERGRRAGLYGNDARR
jgi:2-dehydropantoate 2-reductase